MSEPGPMAQGEHNALRRRRYLHPPVVEAIARFHWATPLRWTFTTPGLLFEQFRFDYPEEPRQQPLFQAGMREEVSDGHNAGSEMRTGPQRILFSQGGGSRLVGVTPTELSVHGLLPYEGWEAIEARLRAALGHVAPCLGEAPPPVDLVGLRYINRVEIPKPSVDFEDFLTISLSFPPSFPPFITTFLDHVEMVYPDEDVKLAFTWASTDATDESCAFILDLDLTATCPLVDLEQAFGVLENLKAKEGQAFEALLTDRLREQFGEVND